MLFNAQEQDNDRDGGKQRRSKQVLPLDEIVAIEDVNTDGNRLEQVVLDQRQCDGVLVPGVDVVFAWFDAERIEIIHKCVFAKSIILVHCVNL